MANMIPNDVEEFTTPGEHKFYKFLEKVAKPDSQYISWYSPDIKGREPDFLLFCKDVGLIVFEVKDWALDQIIDIELHKFIIAKGKREESHKNPLRQAKAYQYNIKDKIQKDGRLLEKNPKYKGKGKIPINHGAIFTNINKYDFIQKRYDEIVSIDKLFFWDDLHPLSNICTDTSGKCFRDTIKKKFPPLFPCRISQDELNYLKQLIYPKIKIELPVRGHSEKYTQRIRRLNILDHNQEAIARKWDGGHRIIQGPSGSGKTIVLIHKAAFLKQYNPKINNILLVCFNITLVNYIKRLLSNKKVPMGDNGVEVLHFHQLCSKIIGEDVAYENESSEYYEAIEQEALSKVQDYSMKYDAILVDEGQDFSDNMYKIVTALLNEETNNLTIALDNNQDIYQRNSSWRELGVQARGRVQKMSHVYRNTIEVFNFASKFIKKNNALGSNEKDQQLELFPGFSDNHGPKPEIKQFPSFDEIIEYTLEKIVSLSEDGYPLSEFAIIYSSKSYGSPAMPTLPDMLKVALESEGILSNWVSEDYRSKKSYDITTNSVTISSIHSLKGFDYSCVFLVGFDFIENKNWTDDQIEKLIYVAVTRARDQLFIPYINNTSLIERLLKSL